MHCDQHRCGNVISHCCFLLFILTVDKITARFMSDGNSLRCHHALRHKFSPNQFIICGEWWVWRILCTGLASCSHKQPSEYRPWHLLVCLAHDLEETLVDFYIHNNCFFSDFKYVFITEGHLCFFNIRHNIRRWTRIHFSRSSVNKTKICVLRDIWIKNNTLF